LRVVFLLLEDEFPDVALLVLVLDFEGLVDFVWAVMMMF
jgi:hypothetical protein